MIVVITILSMLLLGVIATLIRYYPSYRWNRTCRLMYMEFETGYLDNLHNLIETYGVDINRMFEASCLEDIDKEINKFLSEHNSLSIDIECVRQHSRRYKEDISNHIMRKKNKME